MPMFPSCLVRRKQQYKACVVCYTNHYVIHCYHIIGLLTYLINYPQAAYISHLSKDYVTTNASVQLFILYSSLPPFPSLPSSLFLLPSLAFLLLCRYFPKPQNTHQKNNNLVIALEFITKVEKIKVASFGM